MRPAAVNANCREDAAHATRAALLARGDTLASFARRHGFKYGTVQAVLHRRRGLRDAGMSRKIRRALQEALKP